MTQQVKSQLIGEALFLRGFFYFYLINLYGDVPLVTTTDYKINSSLARSSKDDVYKQVFQDLEQAKNLLSDRYLDESLKVYTDFAERVRPSKWAAAAIAARAYLFAGDYSNAEKNATVLINNNELFQLTDLHETFLRNSKEAIWQLQPIQEGLNTEDALLYIIPESGPSDYYFGGNPVF